jgi:hypothetical protein
MALLIVSLAIPGLSTGQSDQDSGRGTTQIDSATPGVHDFDFLVGQWRVHHRTLKERLANSHEWIEFEGTLVNQPLMGGYSNVDDTVFEKPGAPFRGVALRSFDSKTQQWSIWWLDSRTPLGPVDPPMRGGFRDGVGTFYADETLQRETGPHTIFMDQDYSDIVSLGAGVLARWWQDVGDQLGTGHRTSSLIGG